MDFEQAGQGPVLWNFPSPSATPTNGSFNAEVFQTPRTTTHPSHFQDAFGTPQMEAFSTPFQPQYNAMTPAQRPQTSSETMRSNFFAHLQAQGNQPMLPPGRPQYPCADATPTHTSVAQVSPAHHPQLLATGFSHIQTPPPTRGKTRAIQPAPVTFGTPSPLASRRYMTLSQPAAAQNMDSVMPQTPIQFPQLHFSPETAQFCNMGPVSAPVMPQTHILWDASPDVRDFAQQPHLDDPFAPNFQQVQVMSTPQSGVPPALFETPAMSSFPVLAPQQRSASVASISGATGAAVPQNGLPMSDSNLIDPSLVYNSPKRPIAPLRGKSKKSSFEARPRVSRKDSVPMQQHIRSDTVASDDTVVKPTRAGNASGLQRSNTVGASRPKTANPLVTATESLTRSNSIDQPPRTSSPFKRANRMSLGPILEGRSRLRASVILTVDENGRARTETLRADPSPTQSIRDRYPGLFDSDSSDDESDSSEQVSSRNPSFSFPNNELRRAKAARLDPPVENLDGLDLPRPRSAMSVDGVPPSRAAIAAAAQLRRQSSTRKPVLGRIASKRRPTTRASESNIDSCSMNVQDEPDAIMGRDGNLEAAHSTADASTAPAPDVSYGLQPIAADSTLEAHNRRWSLMSSSQLQTLEPQGNFSFRSAESFQEHAGQAQENQQLQTQCVCNTIRDQDLMQCNSCAQWFHASCADFGPYGSPTSRICFLCAGTPNQLC